MRLITNCKRLFLVLLTQIGLLSSIAAQEKMTAEHWQEDLRFLQETAHKDFSFLFKKITSDEFDSQVDEFYQAIPNMQEHEIKVGFARMVASFQYGHTVFSYWDKKMGMHQLPTLLYHFDDGIYLHGLHKEYEKGLGAKLLAIEGVPIEEALEKMRPAVPAENDQFVKAYGIHYLTIPEFLHAQGIMKEYRTEVTYTLEKNGEVFDLILKAGAFDDIPMQYGMIKPEPDWLEARDTIDTPLYLKNLDKIYYYEYLPEQKTVYVRHSQIQDEEGENIPAFYKKVFVFVEQNDVEKFVLDVRLNGGGNNYKNKPIVTGIIETQKINQTGKFFVILGRRTFSACQNLVNELHNYTNAIFIGEPTGENINFYGDNRPVTLPNSQLDAYLSFAWWQDKPQWENGPWLAPHLATGMTFEQYRNNQDPALELALAFDDENFILDPMRHLTALFEANKIEELKAEGLRMAQDPRYSFFDFESELDKAGYQLLAAKRLEEAIFVFGLNSEYYPDSPRVWVSLAEANWNAGNLQQARELFQKAISMDPDGPVGANATKMLLKLNEENPEDNE